MTVLVVDDHPSFCAVARTVLEAEGMTVVGIAQTGEEAVSETLRLQPDVVLLDVHLPDMSGFDVIERLRESGSTAAVVLTSSRDVSHFGPLIAESGACGFVEKASLSGEAVRALVADGGGSLGSGIR